MREMGRAVEGFAATDYQRWLRGQEWSDAKIDSFCRRFRLNPIAFVRCRFARKTGRVAA